VHPHGRRLLHAHLDRPALCRAHDEGSWSCWSEPIRPNPPWSSASTAQRPNRDGNPGSGAQRVASCGECDTAPFCWRSPTELRVRRRTHHPDDASGPRALEDVLEVVSHSRWPCNSNSVCLGSCHLPRPEARSTDFGLSAGILAAGPAEPAYSLETPGVTGVVRRRRPLRCLCGSQPLPVGLAETCRDLLDRRPLGVADRLAALPVCVRDPVCEREDKAPVVLDFLR
jgi:hypothetical protein